MREQLVPDSEVPTWDKHASPLESSPLATALLLVCQAACKLMQIRLHLNNTSTLCQKQQI